MADITFSRRGYSLINSYIDKYKTENVLENVDAFYHLVLDLFFNLNSSEREDSITDTNYNQARNNAGGHDRGIDSIHIENKGDKKIIHFLNFKYKTSFEGCTNNLPSGEIDKICTFFNNLYTKDISSFGTMNQVLRDKITEIIKIMETSFNFEIKFYFCSNNEKELEASENERLKRNLRDKKISFTYIIGPNLISRLEKGERESIDAEIKFIGKQFFEKTDGDIKAIIVNMDVRDLIRIVIENETLRKTHSPDDYEEIRNFQILDHAFYDNVRIYQKQRGKINKNIKSTALNSEENGRFFYFNNGVTLTCDKISFNPSLNSPIAKIENLQVVNGCQTIYSLFEAFLEDPSKFENINILCKIYETENKILSVNIAEFTNSQNPVKSRDIRSVDYTQILLEKELLAKGFFYERKKNQYIEKPSIKRIDAEKIGQLLLSFYNELPAEAKNKKSLIFSDWYDEIFNDNVNSEEVLLVTTLFESIEKKKKEEKRRLSSVNIEVYQEDSFILHASLYLLYLLKRYASLNKIQLKLDNRDSILEYYEDSKNILLTIVREKMNEENYSHGSLFKSKKLKDYIKEKLKINSS